MSKYLLITEHVNPHVLCSGRTKAGVTCALMTNSVCGDCKLPVCGRHESGHRCWKGLTRP